MKLTKEDKIKIINLYFKQGYGFNRIGKLYNVSHSTIESIIYRYKKSY